MIECFYVFQTDANFWYWMPTVQEVANRILDNCRDEVDKMESNTSGFYYDLFMCEHRQCLKMAHMVGMGDVVHQRVIWMPRPGRSDTTYNFVFADKTHAYVYEGGATAWLGDVEGVWRILVYPENEMRQRKIIHCKGSRRKEGSDV